jgi:hypothetical protein
VSQSRQGVPISSSQADQAAKLRSLRKWLRELQARYAQAINSLEKLPIEPSDEMLRDFGSRFIVLQGCFAKRHRYAGAHAAAEVAHVNAAARWHTAVYTRVPPQRGLFAPDGEAFFGRIRMVAAWVPNPAPYFWFRRLIGEAGSLR